MSNIEEAKKILQEKETIQKVSNAINTPKTTKRKILRMNDIYEIKNILDKKLRKKENKQREQIIETAKTKYQSHIQEIHKKAITLRKEIIALKNKIEKENHGIVELKDKGYNYPYWQNLPETMEETEENDYITTTNDLELNTEIEEEIEKFILNLRVGLASPIDIQKYINKIEKL